MPPVAQMTVKCNGDVLRLQNTGGKKLDSDGVQTCNFKHLLSAPASSASPLYRHFHSCQSCTRMLLLLLTHGSFWEGSPICCPLLSDPISPFSTQTSSYYSIYLLPFQYLSCSIFIFKSPRVIALSFVFLY